MSDINLNLNLLTSRYEASTKRVTSVTRSMASDVLKNAANIKSGLVQFEKPLIAAEKSAFSLRNRFKELTPEVAKSSSGFASLGKTIFAGVGLFSLAQSAIRGVSQAISTSARNYIELENAQIAVGKTTSLTNAEIQELTSTFNSLSGRIPTSTNELLRLGAVAGQLGIDGVDNIALFAETIAKLGSASDLTGEEAAKSLARILNVTQESADNVDNLASAIVGLGNSSAASESEITRVAIEVAKATSQFRIGSANAVGLAAALKSLGQQAQLGGSVVGKTFREINNAVQKGGDDLDRFAKIAGVSSKTFADSFNADKTRGFQLFIEGLGRIKEEDISSTLESIGLKGDEVNKVLPVLAQRADLVGESLRRSNKDYNENVAVTDEANRAYKSLSSQLEILGNNFANIGTSIAGGFADPFAKVVEGANRLFNIFSGDQSEVLVTTEEKLRDVVKTLADIESGAISIQDAQLLGGVEALEATRVKLANIVNEADQLNQISRQPADLKLRGELVELENQLKLTELGFDATFGANPKRADTLREEIEQVKNQLVEINKVAGPEAVAGTGGEDTKRNKDTINKEKELQIQITQIKKNGLLEREQAELESKRLRGEADFNDLDRLKEIEQEKLNIFFEAEQQKAQLITDENIRKLEIEKLQNEALIEEEKLKNEAIKEESKALGDFRKKANLQLLKDEDAKLKAQEKLRKDELDKELAEQKKKEEANKNFEKNKVRDTLGAAGQLAGALSNLAAKGSGERKAFAIADATINTYLAATRALAEGGPFAGPVLAAATIAQGLAQVSKITSTGNFANGGIIGGSSNTGDRLTANVNSGEMILNRRQQTELFNQSNGNSNGGGMSPEMVSQIVRDTVSNMNVTLVANDNEIARSASRGSINGVVIGVSE